MMSYNPKFRLGLSGDNTIYSIKTVLCPQNFSKSRKQRLLLDQHVAEVFTARKKRSGSPETTLDLQDQGQHYNRKTVAASMKRQGLRAKAAKKFKATTNSKHNLPVAPNLLQQNFNASISERMTASLTCDALQVALWRRCMPRWVIVHSDRGS